MARMADEDIVQLIDDPREKPAEQGPRWKIAVIDDEPAVHDGTRFALGDYRLHGQGLEILSAYSAAEGRELMRRHADVAVVLLDVIMETDTAGLSLVEFIRKELKNETVRIILRTGQPGQAPERRVIVDRSEEHTSELQSLRHLVCRLLLEKKKQKRSQIRQTDTNTL